MKYIEWLILFLLAVMTVVAIYWGTNNYASTYRESKEPEVAQGIGLPFAPLDYFSRY